MIMKGKTLNNGNIEVIPIRIREARVARGFSMIDLADRIGVTRQAISKYELGASRIGVDKLLSMCEVLDFPLDFFLKPKEDSSDRSSKSVVFFRSVNIPKKTKSIYKQKIEFISEILCFLERYIDFPPLDLLDARNVKSQGYLSDSEIESIALNLRNNWGLGLDPIDNLANLLLKKGFIVSRVELETVKTDALSRWHEERPYIIIGSDKNCAVRSRFDLAHELGHLLLHSHLEQEDISKNHKQIEKEANKFAGAFLLPYESFSNDIYNINIDNFIVLKKKWKVSISSMIRRCYDLDLITDKQYSNLNRYLNRKRWRIKEPLDDVIEHERPNLFKEAFELLIDNKIVSVDYILEEIALNSKEIESLCFLPEGFFYKYVKDKSTPKLRLIK